MSNELNTLLLSTYAHLKTLNENYQYKDVAVNVRKHLKVKFPNTKFKVISGVNKLDVTWTDSCTKNDVDKALEVFVKGSFNGHDDDSWDIKSTSFTNLFGGVKYIMTTRSYSPEYTNECIKTLKAELGGQHEDFTFEKFHEGLLIDIYPDNSDSSYAELLREKMYNQSAK